MEKLIAELKRLYLPAYTVPPDTLARHLLGQANVPVKLATLDGRARALSIPFFRMKDGAEDQHWQRLCDVANALQTDLGLPAPAVSIDGAEGYRLWLSFETPVAAEDARRLLALLTRTYAPDVRWSPDLVDAPVELPPSLNERTGKWAAFIHPGMGGAFADEPGLEIPPPLAGQVAFLEGLESIGAAQFEHALARLAQGQGEAPAAAPSPAEEPAFPGDLLLRDATLEDIVRFLHAKHIEPTFRHLIR